MWTIRTRLLLVAALSIVAVASIACGSDDDGGGAGAADTQTVPTTTSSGSIESNAVQTGLDENCVQNVLGRAAVGFADVTESERALVLEQCGGGGPEFSGGAGGGFLASLPSDCIEETLGAPVDDFRDISSEDRSALLEACAADLGDVGSRFPGGISLAGPGGRITGLLEQEPIAACAEEELGRPVSASDELTPEEMTQIITACLPALGEGRQGSGAIEVRPGSGDGSTITIR